MPSLIHLLLIIFVSLLTQGCESQQPPIRVGVLHSLTGTMAFSEKPLVDALTLAAEELNRQKGGVLGRRIELVIVDGQSDETQFALEAERLITEEKVAVIFGCWTSSCRKAIKPVIEKHQHLLFYPLQYEGLEQSPDIIYTGATPNQQIIPSLPWALKNLGTSFLLIGSDYIYPRTANTIIKEILPILKGKVLGEHYIPLGATDMHALMQAIEKHQPDVIINTINGDSNIPFFKALKQLPFIPVISYSIAEPELQQIDPQLTEGHYSVWNYFQSIDTPRNQLFTKLFKQRFGQHRTISDPMEASYIGLHLWAKAAKQAKSTQAQDIKNAINYISLNAPEGRVAVNAKNHHLWKTTRIGLALDNGQFEIVWQSNNPLKPQPFPHYKSKFQWQTYLLSQQNKAR